ncbi:MAG: ribonuclease PH [Deltaproteobacteria bacterium]|nr:ribonuclease PH [Deltaproteobacteria bacterium]
MNRSRSDGRKSGDLRSIHFQLAFNRFAEGSVLTCFGDTVVLCNASVEETVPPFLRGQGRGWITAEYAMIPRAGQTRSPRESVRGKINGRTHEIQRLIGRSLRAVTDLSLLGERTIVLDCDVLQADGGTRTAAVTGSCLALFMALKKMLEKGQIGSFPLREMVAAVSVGLVEGIPLIDLNYEEDSRAAVDMNFVVTESGHFVEIQGTGEEAPFTGEDFEALRELALSGIRKLIHLQQEALR